MRYTPPAVFDADAYVIENDDTWEFLEPAEANTGPNWLTIKPIRRSSAGP